MLQGIRERSQSWIMWVIVGLLILMFALWGIQSYLGPSGDPAVADINGTEISLRSFQDQLQRQRYRLQNLTGANLNLSPEEDEKLKSEVLSAMVEEEILIQSALDDGLLIGDQQLAQVIRSMEAFQQDGEFSQAAYERVLVNQGYRPGGFEYFFRRSLLLGQLNAGIASSAFMTDEELDEILRLMMQRRSFAVLTIPVDRYLADVTVTEQQVSEYYQANADEFVQPERVSVEYIELARDSLARNIQISEQQVEQRYEEEKSGFSTDEERSARHILIRIPADADAAAEQQAEQSARALKDRLDQGESFEELAKSDSQDPGSAQQGGDLGFFPRGVMDPAFEEAVFAMQPGELSEPVRSGFGLHLIKLQEIKAAVVKPLADVRSEIVRQLQLEEAEKDYAEQAEQFANLVFEAADTLEEAASAFDLEIQSSELFTRQEPGPGLLGEPRFMNAAFSDEVRQGSNSEPLEFEGGRLVALRLKEYKPVSQRPLETVKSELMEKLRLDAARGSASGQGQVLLDQLNAGETADSVAAGDGLEWKQYEALARSAQQLDAALMGYVFKMPKPTDTDIYSGFGLASGDFSVIALSDVDDDPNDAESVTAVRRQLKQQLVLRYGEQAYDALTQAMKSQASISIYKDRL